MPDRPAFFGERQRLPALQAAFAMTNLLVFTATTLSNRRSGILARKRAMMLRTLEIKRSVGGERQISGYFFNVPDNVRSESRTDMPGSSFTKAGSARQLFGFFVFCTEIRTKPQTTTTVQRPGTRAFPNSYNQFMLYKTVLWPYCFPYAYFPGDRTGPPGDLCRKSVWTTRR